MPTRESLGRRGYERLEHLLTQRLRSMPGHEDAAPTPTEIEEAVESLPDTRWMLVTLAFGLNGQPLNAEALLEVMRTAYPAMRWSTFSIQDMMSKTIKQMVNHLARERKEPALHPLDEPSAAEVAADCMRRRLIQVEFWRLIRSLSPVQFDNLVLVYLERQDPSRVAAQMGVTRSAVHAASKRAVHNIATRAPHVAPKLLEAL